MNDINPAVYDLLCLLEVSIRRLPSPERPASVNVLLGQLEAERSAAKIAEAIATPEAQTAAGQGERYDWPQCAKCGAGPADPCDRGVDHDESSGQAEKGSPAPGAPGAGDPTPPAPATAGEKRDALRQASLLYNSGALDFADLQGVVGYVLDYLLAGGYGPDFVTRAELVEALKAESGLLGGPPAALACRLAERLERTQERRE